MQRVKKVNTTIGVSIGLVCIAFMLVIVAFACPHIASIRRTYFDINNGWVKIQYINLWGVYQESIVDTDYRELLQSINDKELPANWQLANQERLGILVWFYPQHESHRYGKILHEANMFALWVKFADQESESTQQQVIRLGRLVKEGNVAKVAAFVDACERRRKGVGEAKGSGVNNPDSIATDK